MSRSRNTENLQVKSDLTFDVESIKIIIRKPREGDIHPLTKKEVRGILNAMPSKYVYQLKTVELLPRKSEPGRPWGQYRESDKKIILYSHPLVIEDGSEFALNIASKSNRSFSLLADNIMENGKHYSVWSKEMLLMFYFEVLCHEIGHHYTSVTKFQKKMPIGKTHEVLANLYKDRLITFVEPLGKFLKDKSENILFHNGLNEFIRKEILEKN